MLPISIVNICFQGNAVDIHSFLISLDDSRKKNILIYSTLLNTVQRNRGTLYPILFHPDQYEKDHFVYYLQIFNVRHLYLAKIIYQFHFHQNVQTLKNDLRECFENFIVYCQLIKKEKTNVIQSVYKLLQKELGNMFSLNLETKTVFFSKLVENYDDFLT